MTDKPTLTVKPLTTPTLGFTHGVYYAGELPTLLGMFYTEAEARRVAEALSAAGDLERAAAYFETLSPRGLWSNDEVAAALREKWWER